MGLPLLNKYQADLIISSSFTDVQGLHNWIKNWTLSAQYQAASG